MEGKPVFIPQEELSNNDPVIRVNRPSTEHSDFFQEYPYNSNSTTRATLGVTNTESGSFVSETNSMAGPSTSYNSLAVQNDSVPSNIHEMGTSKSLNSSMHVQPGSPRSSVIELGSDSAQPGSVHIGYQANTHALPDQNANIDNYRNLGYLAPDHTRVPSPCDPTAIIHSPPIGYKIITSLKKLNTIRVKFYGMGKRRFYWEIWEKDTGNFGTYKDFRESWNPDTKIRKVIWSDIKASGKNINTSYGVFDNNRRVDGISEATKDLLRKKRPFKK